MSSSCGAVEATYSRGQDTTTQAEEVYRDTLHLNTVDGQVPTYTGLNAKQLTWKFNQSIKEQVRNSTREQVQAKVVEHMEGLKVQGSLLTLAAREKQDILWKSVMFQLKSGTLKFMMNASIDTLATPANLCRWKYTTSSSCKLCPNKGTTDQILNCCRVMLDTWRHNNLVNFVVNNIDSKFTVYSDIPGWEAPVGGTIPPALCVTRLKDSRHTYKNTAHFRAHHASQQAH